MFRYKNSKFILFILLFPAITTFSACKMTQKYTLTKIGSDQILNGSVQKSVLQDAELFPWFNYGYQTYQTNPETLGKLKPIKDSIHVLIIAGTWCSDTQRELPRFMKIMDQIGVPSSQIELLMVDQQKKCDYFNIEAIQVSHVPSFIFYQNETETGRIVEMPDSTLELSIQSFYFQPKK